MRGPVYYTKLPSPVPRKQGQGIDQGGTPRRNFLPRASCLFCQTSPSVSKRPEKRSFSGPGVCPGHWFEASRGRYSRCLRLVFRLSPALHVGKKSCVDEDTGSGGGPLRIFKTPGWVAGAKPSRAYVRHAAGARLRPSHTAKCTKKTRFSAFKHAVFGSQSTRFVVSFPLVCIIPRQKPLVKFFCYFLHPVSRS